MMRPENSTEHTNARAVAADLVNAVLLHGRSLTAALASVRRDTDRRTLAAAQDLAYLVMRQAGRLRFFLDRLANRPIHPPDLLGVLLVGLAQFERGGTPAYAAVNETVSLAGHRHPRARGFVNALLRNFQRQHPDLARQARADPVAHWNFPTWWIDRLRDQFPDAWEETLAAMNLHPPMTLRINQRRAAVADYLGGLIDMGIQARQTGEWAVTLERPMGASELPGFTEGKVSIQDLGAQFAMPILECEDGMRVLDACAAPGGKATHLLEAHALHLIALDASAQRLLPLGESLERLGLSAQLQVGDAGRPDAWWDGQRFDRILLDAPCTGSGVARRHPDGRWLKRCEDVTALATRQATLLEGVWPLLRPGGKLVYATCSLFREENSDQVESFLRRHRDAKREPINLPDARQGQLLPDAEHDGFFYARMVKA